MLQQLRFKSEDYDQVWICADLHLNQKSGVCLKDRGFSPHETPQDHDDYIEWFWRNNITSNSLVINLGDIVFNDPKGEAFERVSKWPAMTHLLLWGNHNSGSSNAYKTRKNQLLIDSNQEIYPVGYNNIIFAGTQLEIKLDSKPIVLNHFPLAIHNNMGKGFWHLCGHSHHTFPDTRHTNPDNLTLDCGVDSAFHYSNFQKPFFTWDDIKTIMSKKAFKQKDHHSEETT